MNFKILSIMIISVCMYNYVYSSSIPEIEIELNIMLFKRALFQENDYVGALILLNDIPLHENVSCCKDIERQIDVKERSLSIELIKATEQHQKENIQRQQEQLKTIATFVSNQKEKAKELVKTQIANQYGCSCAVQ